MNNKIMSPIDSTSNNQKFLKEMIDIFSKATGLNVVAVDIDGNAFLSSEDYQNVGFCQYIKRNNPNGCEQCQKTYRKACRECYRWNEPYFFVCHAGLVMWAVPIVINNVHIGAIICGQVLLWEPDELYFDELEQYHSDFSPPLFNALKKEAMKLKVISVNKCQSAANLLSVIVKYMANTYDTAFMEQKSLLEWRNAILSRIEKQKSEHAGETFDLSVYLHREKRFLQAMRMADKKRADQLIPLLFTDIEMLSGHNMEHICRMLEELLILSSRALIEAGLEIDVVMDILDDYRMSLPDYTHSEEVFRYTYQVFTRLLESAYFLINSMEHTSIIKSVRKYIDDHFNEKISMTDIADSVSLSPSYLSSLFKKKMNMTIHDYLIRVRIEKSIELLNNRDLSIKEVMQQCGIESQSYYNKIFKKMIGITPGKYRNQLL